MEKTLSQEQLDLVARFLDAYNRIDKFFEKELMINSHTYFSDKVSKFSTKYSKWQEKSFLLDMGNLRNIIIHNESRVSRYPCVPSVEIVEKMEKICKDLTEPKRVYPKYQCEVIKFQTLETLVSVLHVIKEKQYSQFPIYHENQFKGLLTENGITRWLSQNYNHENSIIDFSDTSIGLVLTSEEEKKKNHKFISRTVAFMEAQNQFIQNPACEALLITDSGNQKESLLGIITRWDLLQE